MGIRVHNVTKRFGEFVALFDFEQHVGRHAEDFDHPLAGAGGGVGVLAREQVREVAFGEAELDRPVVLAQRAAGHRARPYR